MKKIILTLALILSVVAVKAQRFGITGNLAFDKLESNLIQSIKPGLGWGVGIKVRLVGLTGFGLDGALKYASESIEYSDFYYENSQTRYTVDGRSDRVSYLSIPVHLRYDLKFLGNAFVPFAFIGPEFAYAFEGFDFKNDKAKDYFNENKAQWNLDFGLGVILAAHLELTYNYMIRMSDRFEGLSNKDLFNSSSNKVGLTYYF